MTYLVSIVLDPLPVWTAAAALAALFAHAALGKLADRALFEQHLAAYGVPVLLQPTLAWALPALEGLVALALLSPLRGLGALLAALLLLAYATAMAWHLARGDEGLDCGCGGEPLPLAWPLVARNAVLALLAGVAAATTNVRATGPGDFVAATGAVVLGALLYAALHQLLRHRAHLHAVH